MSELKNEFLILKQKIEFLEKELENADSTEKKILIENELKKTKNELTIKKFLFPKIDLETALKNSENKITELENKLKNSENKIIELENKLKNQLYENLCDETGYGLGGDYFF